MRTSICFLIVSLYAATVAAFTQGPHNQRSALVRPAQRQICEFDASDFTLLTGDWPYSKEDMNRLDNSKDTSFYESPRFVTHIDDRAIMALTEYYQEEMSKLAEKKGDKLDVLDLCSSWISHFPESVAFNRCVGIGMNEKELSANRRLTEYYVQDLNESPTLNFEDNSFDVICNVVSVDYLTKPREIFQEMHRILRPGGLALMSFSNRCFPSKAVAMWLQADDIGRLSIVASYFHYSASWKSIEALDIIPEKKDLPTRPSLEEMMKEPSKGFAWMSSAAAVQKMNTGDPMYVVKGVK